MEAVGCVDVLVDSSGRLGPLSYLVPEGFDVRPGSGVVVPFGSRTSAGVVVGAGDPQRATRPLLSVDGVRCGETEVAVARSLAERHFCDPAVLFARLAPKSPKPARRRTYAAAALAGADDLSGQLEAFSGRRRYLLVEPALPLVRVAAAEALRLSGSGQVLVLCPTVDSADDLVASFAAGAARVSGSRAHGAWRAFVDGELSVGVGTRAAALYSARDLAAIVVVDDQHPGHREPTLPYTHARDVAIARCAASSVQLSIVSHSPSAVGMLGQKCHLVAGGWPEMVLVDTAAMSPSQRWLPNVALRRSALPSVVIAPTTQRWRCQRCQAPAEITCPKPLARTTVGQSCGRCGGDRFYRTRLDADYAAAAFKGRASAITWPELRELAPPSNVIVGDVDVYAAPSLTPEADLARRLLAAAAAAGAGGRVVAWHRNASPTLDMVFSRDLLALARTVWASAKANCAPPFSAVVEIHTTGRSAPVVAGWPGRVNGPRRTKDDEWHVLVTLAPAQVSDLQPFVARLRRSRKVRLTVQY